MRVAEYVVHALLHTNYFERQSHSHSLGVHVKYGQASNI